MSICKSLSKSSHALKKDNIKSEPDGILTHGKIHCVIYGHESTESGGLKSVGEDLPEDSSHTSYHSDSHAANL